MLAGATLTEPSAFLILWSAEQCPPYMEVTPGLVWLHLCAMIHFVYSAFP